MTIARTVMIGERTVTRIGLGTNRLTDTAENREFLRAAVDAGVEMIDTAHLYTDGESERTIGALLGEFPENVVVATKGGFHEAKPDVLRRELEQSFESLGVEQIELYYLHRVDPEVALEESLGVIAEARDQGRIAHVGLSKVSVEEIERAREVVPITAVQNEYNLGARGDDDVISYCEREGIVFVPYYPLRAEVPALGELAAKYDATPQQITLAWMLKRSPAVLPIPGTRSIEHLRSNLAALDIELDDADYERLTG